MINVQFMSKEFSGREIDEVLHEMLTMAVEEESILEAICEKYDYSQDEVRDIVERAQFHADPITL